MKIRCPLWLAIEQTHQSESPTLCSFLYGTIISDRPVGLHTHRAFACPYAARGLLRSRANETPAGVLDRRIDAAVRDTHPSAADLY